MASTQAALLHELGDQRPARRFALAVVVGEILERAHAVVLGGAHEELLAGLALGQRRPRQHVGRQRPLGEVVDTGEVVAAAGEQ